MGKPNFKLYLLIAFCLLLSLTTYGQTSKKLDLSLKEKTLKEFFQTIESKTEFTFMYNNVDLEQKISIDVRQATLDNVLKTVLTPISLVYEVRGKQILIKELQRTSSDNQSKKTITGTVIDEQGESIIGANIMEKGTTNGVVTDYNGQFSISVSENATLQISYLGYIPQEVSGTNKTNLSITLQEDAMKLDEIVVVGYGVQKKSDLTGAISSVKAKDLPLAASTSVGHMLSGKAAGLSAFQANAQPGGQVNLQIRGQASNRAPLIIIDGFPQTGFSQPGGGYSHQGNVGSVETSLNSLNPNDIESIEILKDASATSIYGARAAGGVILITTKRGREGKVQVNYKASVSTQRMYGLPDMMNNTNFMTEINEVIKETWMRTNKVYPYGGLSYEEAVSQAGTNGITTMWAPKYTENDFINPLNTDWLGAATRNGFIQEHNLSVDGGNDKTRYMTSLNYYSQEGSIKNNGVDRFSMRINLDQKFSDIITGGLTAFISQNKNDNVTLNSGFAEQAGIIRSAQQFNPTLPIKDENGNYTIDLAQASLPNPISLLEIKDKSVTERLMLIGYLRAEPIKDLSIKAQVAVDRNQGKRDTYMPTTVLLGSREGGYATKSQSYKTDYNVSLIANWRKKFGDHSIDLMAGYDYEEFHWDGFDAMNSKFPYDGVEWNNLAAGSREKPGVGSFGGKSNLASYLTRLNYTLKDKYLLTINFRVDGSSNFAPNKQWGSFGGASLGWKIHEEEFMINTREWLSELKLRGGWGQTGNDEAPGIYTYYTTGWNYLINGTLHNGIGLAALGNPDLKWETQTDINVGLDFGLLNQRVIGTVEYFNRVVTDLIGDRALMTYLPVNTIKANLSAEKETNGFEVSLTSHNMNNRSFRWTTNATFTYYRDKWKKRDISWQPDIYNTKHEYFNELWRYKSDGLVSVDDKEYIEKYGAIPGTIKILDLNGYKKDENGNNVLDENGIPMYTGEPDGKIDNADLVKKAVNQPFTIGLNNSFDYKNFDLGVYFYGAFNRWKDNDTKRTYHTESFRMTYGANMEKGVINRWSYDNMNSDVPSIFQSNSSYGTGDYYLEKAWFIRCRNITLGYTFNQNWMKKVFSSARIFFDAQNPFVITPYSGTDPETDYMAAYPNARTFSFGIDIRF